MPALTVERHFRNEAETVRRCCDEACYHAGNGKPGLAGLLFSDAEHLIDRIGLCGADTTELVRYLRARREAVTPPGELV